MIVTFCGHRQCRLSQEEVQRLTDTLYDIVRQHPDAVFYLGGYGQFDEWCNRVLKSIQQDYPAIQRIFVTPYIHPNYGRLQDGDQYDGTLYPPLEDVPPRFCIAKRNEWMVQQADYIVAYVRYDWGGAYNACTYAISKQKQVVNLGDDAIAPH